MGILNELGRKYGTDKSSEGKRGAVPGSGHDYLWRYELFLEARRHRVRRVLEIGVQRGASIRMWAEYFPQASIFGIDIAESALHVTGDRIQINLVDQSDAAALDAFAREFGPFDVVIEDGSHIWGHQITTLQALLPHVAAGGVYVVEDLHTSYSQEWAGSGGPTGIDYVLRCCEKVIGDNRMRSSGGDDEAFLLALARRVSHATVMRRSAAFFVRDDA